MNIMQMSLQAAVIIVAVVVIRALGMGKLPKWSFQLLWGVALMRLLVPLRIESPVSVYGAVRQVEQVWSNAPAPTTTQTGSGAAKTMMQQAGEALTATPPNAAHTSPWLIVWIVGAALMLGYFVFTHVRCRKVYRTARLVSDTRVSQLPHSRPLHIRASRRIEAPLTYGVLRPVILLPERLLAQGKEVEYVIAHELAHVRHWDILKRWVLTICLCVHWFNPLVWVMYVLAGRDIELCCDETVLRKYGAQKRARYASLLIDMEEARTALTPLASHFNKTAIEERIVAIMKHKRVSFFGVILALVLVVFAATALATNAVTNTVAIDEATSPATTWGGLYDNEPQSDHARFAPYAKYGLTYNASNGRLYYDGELVRYFDDMYPIGGPGDNAYVGVSATYEDGTVDVYGVRDLTPIDNGDGSVDPSGVLLGLRRGSKAEFDGTTKAIKEMRNSSSPPTTFAPDSGGGGRTLAEVFAEYTPYGLQYVQSEDRLYLNGQRVRTFCDFLKANSGKIDSSTYDGPVFSKSHSDGDIDVYALRDASGQLMGLRVASKAEFDQRVRETTHDDPVQEHIRSSDDPTYDDGIVWWTSEEYEKWLDEERVNLQNVIGSRGYTGGDGWFTWTQEKVDETVAMYEEILDQLRRGVPVPKSVNGQTDISVMAAPTGDDSVGVGNAIVQEDLPTATAVPSNGDFIIDTTNAAENIPTATAAPNNGDFIINTVTAHDVAAVPAPSSGISYSAVFSSADGSNIELGSFDSYVARYEAVKAFCDAQVKAGQLGQGDADRIIGQFD